MDDAVSLDRELAGFRDNLGNARLYAPGCGEYVFFGEKLAVVEAYKKGRIACAFQLQPGHSDTDAARYVAIGNSDAPDLDVAMLRPVSVDEFDIGQFGDPRDGEQSDVLVVVVELSQGPKGEIAVRAVDGGSVGLCFGYEIDEWLGRARQFTHSSAVKTGLVQVDGKACISSWLKPSSSHGVGGEKVQRTSQIVDYVADNGGTVVGDRSLELQGNAPTLRIWVRFEGNAVWVVTEKSIDDMLQIRDVALGPCDLQLGSKSVY